nr:DNA methyltransferase [Symbiobacterium terraclitae]
MTCDPDWSFSSLSAKETSEGTHAYHSYPMRFVPQLVRKVLQHYTPPGAVIMDPFMGSGTTIVEAALKGHAVIGIDVNPLAKLITDAKVTPIDPVLLSHRVDCMFERAERMKGTAKAPFEPRASERIDFWFPPSQREKLEALLAAIQAERNGDVRRLLMCGFSNILKCCSLWYPGSTKPVRSDKRRRNPEDPFKAMSRQLRIMAERNEELFEYWGPTSAMRRPPIKTLCRDIRLMRLPASSVDCVITSPPYVTSYDYAELHQLSLLWLGYAANHQDIRPSFMGAVHGLHPSQHPTRELGSNLAASIVDDLRESPAEPHLVRAVTKYYQDMWLFVRKARRVLKPGGVLVLVIGNTVLRGVLVRNAEALAEMGEKQGLRLTQVIRRRIPLKSIPQRRDPVSGRFTSHQGGTANAYPEEYVIVMNA